MKKLLIFASGSKDGGGPRLDGAPSGGGSGFQELVENTRTGVLKAEIVAVVSNHENGGVRKKANNLDIPFEYFEKPDQNVGRYAEIVDKYKADFVALSGWLKKISGLDPRTTINIHPGLMPEFGGPGMYGHFVHEAAMRAFGEGKIKISGVSMHFVTDEYDRGPVFFEFPVWIRLDDTAESLAQRVNKIEHAYQSWIINLVITGQITWDGKNNSSLRVPSWYPFLPKSR